MEAEEKQRRVDGMLSVSGVPEDYRDADALDFSTLPDPAGRKLADARQKIRDHVNSQFLIGLIGPRGTGKTSVATAVVLEECRQVRRARYVLAHNYVQMCSRGRFGGKPSEAEVEAMYMRPPLLVIDELHLVALADRDDVALKVLIQNRWDAKKCTVLLSNETAAAFAQQIGASLADRMQKDGGKYGGLIRCEWSSLRVPAKPV